MRYNPVFVSLTIQQEKYNISLIEQKGNKNVLLMHQDDQDANIRVKLPKTRGFVPQPRLENYHITVSVSLLWVLLPPSIQTIDLYDWYHQDNNGKK